MKIFNQLSKITFWKKLREYLKISQRTNVTQQLSVPALIAIFSLFASSSAIAGFGFFPGENNNNYLWKNNTIHYVVDSSYRGSRSDITTAVNHWRSTVRRTNNTPLFTFTELTRRPTNNHEGYILFTGLNEAGSPTNQCYTRQPTFGYPGDVTNTSKGTRYIELNQNCSARTIVHEIGHAIGLMHEHNRIDRDNFINIDFSQVPATTANVTFNNAWTLRTDPSIVAARMAGPFDFDSIMMYGPNDGGMPGGTIITTDAGYDEYDATFGREFGLSQGDIDTVKLMYGETSLIESTEKLGQCLQVSPPDFDWPIDAFLNNYSMTLILTPCNPNSRNQQWLRSGSVVERIISSNGMCLGFDRQNSALRLEHCRHDIEDHSDSQKWFYHSSSSRIISIDSDSGTPRRPIMRCMGASKVGGTILGMVDECGSGYRTKSEYTENWKFTPR